MKRIKWTYLSAEFNNGTVEIPDIKKIFVPKDFPYSDEAEEAAKREAYNGEYEIYDDGLSEPEFEPTATTEDILTALLGV